MQDKDDIDIDDNADSVKAHQRIDASRSASRKRSRSQVDYQSWDLLIASHSADLSGLLLIHRLPLLAEGTSISMDAHFPWRVQHLATPAISVEFSSALYPAPRHSQLLVAEAKGNVRILDCLPRSGARQSLWRVSLYTDYENLPNKILRRKHILDARWVLAGKAILVLLADGNWGVWDIENSGPKPIDTATTPLNPLVECVTGFSVGGWIGNTFTAKTYFKSSSSRNENKSKFAPMTPSTRKVREDALFTDTIAQSDWHIRGGLSVSPVLDTSNSRADDEAVLLWHGRNVIFLPSLFMHWQSKARGSGNLFGSGAKGAPKIINNIHLGGELCTEVSLLPPYHQHTGPGLGEASQPEILVTGEHRLIIVTDSISIEQPVPPQPIPSSIDQQLLIRGELDVNGMDRILAGISNRHSPSRKSESLPT